MLGAWLMTAATQIPAVVDVLYIPGDALTVRANISQNGSPYDWAGITVTALVIAAPDQVNTADPIDTWTVDTSIDGVLLLSLTGAQTAALGTTQHSWIARFVEGGARRTVLAGRLMPRPAHG